MNLIASAKQTIKYFFYFISLSFYFSYGYFFMTKKRFYNRLTAFAA